LLDFLTSLPASVVGAIIAAGGTLISTYLKYRLDKAQTRLEKTETKLTETKNENEALERVKDASLSAIEEVAKDTSLFEIREFEASTTFDEEGSGEHIRKWIGITSSNCVTNLKIPARFWTSGGKSQDPWIETLPGSQLTAHFDTTTQTDTVVEGNIVIAGVISPTTGPVSFLARQKFEHAFLTTSAAVQQAYRHAAWRTEYAVSEVRNPAKTIRRSVSFPATHRNLSPPPGVIVFIGDSEEVDNDELERVKSGLTVLESSATLVVQNPKAGRRYGIFWMPPPGQTH
jgi:hypothetical protein